jgi:TIR domain/SLOG cluster3 family
VLYLLSGPLTGAGDEGESFLALVGTRATSFHPTSILATAAAAALAAPGPDDGVAFVIGDAPMPEAVDFLGRAQASGAVILPIALDVEHRRPPEVVEAAQSFDVADALRRAGLPNTHRSQAARAFTRTALARLAPTCFRGRLRIFVSYRREDGEGLASELDKALSDRHEHVFRDLVSIQTGDLAQDVIDERLREADVVVFIDTPRAGESEWVARELATAMGNGIPVVWVRIGATEGRIPLAVPPGNAPVVELADPDPGPVGEWAEAILDAAFDQAREAIRASTSAFTLIRHWAEEHGATVTALDQRKLIYAIKIPPTAVGTLPRRSRQDIVQLFARTPDSDDVGELSEWLREAGYSDHPLACRAFDAAVLIRPSSIASIPVEDWGVVGSGDGYLTALVGAPGPEEVDRRPVLLLFGAFPAEPTSHAAVIAAVAALARSWLARGGALTFGSHPTFTPLVAEAARAVLPAGARERIRAFRSGYFAGAGFAPDLGEAMTVAEVPAADDLESSLTVMRREMIRPASADVAVIVGGRTTEHGTHAPGVEEELALARAAGIPAVVLASPGGQAAVIVDREREAQPPWSGLGNGMPADVNEFIAEEDDYAEVARIIWERFTSETSI